MSSSSCKQLVPLGRDRLDCLQDARKKMEQVADHDARPSLDAAFAFFLEWCGDEEAEEARGSSTGSASAVDGLNTSHLVNLPSDGLSKVHQQAHSQHQQESPAQTTEPPSSPQQAPQPRLVGHRESARRKRYRLEVSSLQREIKELERRVTRLRKFGGECERIFGVPVGFGRAVAEYNKLQEAKQCNAELKEALAEQQETSTALEKLFKQKLSTQDLDFLSELERQNAGGAEYYELLNQLVDMYARTPAVLATIGTRGIGSVFNSCNEDHSLILGSSHQSITNTPLSSSFRHLEQFVWNQVALNINAKCTARSTHYQLEVPQVNCYGNRFHVVYSEALGGRSMDGMVVIRRFVEPRRVVIVISAHHSFPGSALVIREDGWIIMTDTSKATPDNSGGTLLQTHFHIYTEKQDAPLTKEIEVLRDFVVKALSTKSRLYHQRVQYMILQAAFDSKFSEQLHSQLNLGCVACGLHASSDHEGQKPPLHQQKREREREIPAPVSKPREKAKVLMSFLMDDEEQAMLAEALAFIDMFAHEDGKSASSNSDGSTSYFDRLEQHSPPSSASAAASPVRSSRSKRFITVSSSTINSDDSSEGQGLDDADQRKKKKTKSRAANTDAVYRYRKRNKTEILELRVEVAQLEARLAQLRIRCAVASTKALSRQAGFSRSSSSTSQLQLETEAPSAGFDDTVSEYKRLQESEALNRKLTAAMMMQREANSTLEGFFHKQIAKNDLSSVLSIQRPLAKVSEARKSSSSSSSPSQKDAILFAELFHHLRDTIYCNTASALAAFRRSDVSCVFSNSLLKQDPRVGKVLECTFNTPVSYSLKQLELLMWNHLTQPIDMVSAAQVAQTTLSDEEDNDSQQFTLKSCNRLGDVQLEYVCAIRKFSEPYRVVLAFTSLMTPAGSGLFFRENGWVVLSDSQVAVTERDSNSSAGDPSPSTPKALFQTVYQLHAEQSPSPTTTGTASATPRETQLLSSELLALQDFVLTAQGDRMRTHQLMIQNTLQHPIYAIPIGGILASCLLAG